MGVGAPADFVTLPNTPQNRQALLRLVLLLFCALPFLSQAQAQGRVLISEIHYHPVEEPEFLADGSPALYLSGDVHEFLEIHNSSNERISLNGWRLTGGIDYQFPASASIQPGHYLAIARNPGQLSRIGQYNLRRDQILGPYIGELSNDSDRINLKDSQGRTVDSVAYSSQFPWPVGADGLGASDEWTGLQSRDFQYRGRSLERTSWSGDSSDPGNWQASPVGSEPTPGRANSVLETNGSPVVINFSVLQNADNQRRLRAGQEMRIETYFSREEGLGKVYVEYFADHKERTNEVSTRVLMEKAGEIQNKWQGILPAFAERTVVRYRVLAEVNGRFKQVFPRTGDPFFWKAFFVGLPRDRGKPVYDVIISVVAELQLGKNISHDPRRITLPDPPGLPREAWNATEPAVFVADGEVYDCRIRHHGSRYHRDVKRKSYKVQFPRYKKFNGQSGLFLTDKDVATTAGHALFRAAGLPSSSTRKIDLHINQQVVLERLEEQESDAFMLEQFHAGQREVDPSRPKETPGELYKVMGSWLEEGPYGLTDGRLLTGTDYWPVLDRYEWNYSLQNNHWRGHKTLLTLLEKMWEARGSAEYRPPTDLARLRSVLAEDWDVDEVLTHIALINWCGAWDDCFHNYFFWRRENSKWGLLPWDFDLLFLDETTPINSGEVGLSFSWGPNHIKDSFMRAYRAEFKKRLHFLNNTLLHPTSLADLGLTEIIPFANKRMAYVNSALALGTFFRPHTPGILNPTNNARIFAPAQLKTTAYKHPKNLSHALTTWMIRSDEGDYQKPAFKISTRTNLTSFPVPFERLEFGKTYWWKALHQDSAGIPSLTSVEGRFTFGRATEVEAEKSPLLAEWRYYPLNFDLQTLWRQRSYNDSGWPSGFTPLVSSRSVELPYPPGNEIPPSGKITQYFRRFFVNQQPVPDSRLQLTYLINDGAVFYLNGQEIHRYNMPTGAVNHATPASAPRPGNLAVTVRNLQPRGLVMGTNLFAVEVHQASGAVNDMIFAGALSVETTAQIASTNSLILNEVLADNSTAFQTNSTHPDYIELYNPGTKAISLDGVAITDQILNPKRFLFPSDSTIAPKSYLLVFCDNLGGPGFNTGFGLDKDGQALFLLNVAGSNVVVLDSVNFGFQVRDHSIGRNSQNNAWEINTPTPGWGNRPVALGSLSLKINEWMAYPGNGSDWFEIYNPSQKLVRLEGISLSDSIDDLDKTILPKLSFLGPRSFLTFNADKSAEGRHSVRFGLSSSGDSIYLASGKLVLDQVTFPVQEKNVSQGRLPDGMEKIVSFSASTTKGRSNYIPLNSVLFNEVLSGADHPMEPAIELFNPGGEIVDIGGWFLSHDDSTLQKYSIPAGTRIQPGQFSVFYQDAFIGSGFRLNPSDQNEIWLSEVVQGEITGRRAPASFGPVPAGVSLGRMDTGERVDFVPLNDPTFGADQALSVQGFRLGTGKPNAAPKIWPVIITEVLTSGPLQGTNENRNLEFIELYNQSGAAVKLYDTQPPSNTWRLAEGTFFSFPPGLQLEPQEILLVVGFDLQTNAPTLQKFRDFFQLPETQKITGPFTRKLNNKDETLDLLVPGHNENPTDTNPGFVPYYFADRAHLRTGSNPSSNLLSFHRAGFEVYGGHSTNWTQATPSPGKVPVVQQDADLDQDGMSDVWEKQNGLDPENKSDAFQDSDGDGFSNLNEFMAGTNPRDARSSLRFQIGILNTGHLMLSFEAKPGKIYEILYREGLLAPGWNLIKTFGPETTSKLIEFDQPIQPGSTPRLYRIMIR